MTTCKTCQHREGAPVSSEGECFGAPPPVIVLDGEPVRVRPIMCATDRACSLYRIHEILIGHDARPQPQGQTNDHQQ
ncbi:hypothetical protein [Phenylobacterium conjunctum]|uniref:Uncharacterized protein n=1 Tax=Phenylobacterium conjunctum TaxID=1298959 RepID=A0ABW3SXQ2_9CAUL